VLPVEVDELDEELQPKHARAKQLSAIRVAAFHARRIHGLSRRGATSSTHGTGNRLIERLPQPAQRPWGGPPRPFAKVAVMRSRK
jgi:hypothetical protein